MFFQIHWNGLVLFRLLVIELLYKTFYHFGYLRNIAKSRLVEISRFPTPLPGPFYLQGGRWLRVPAQLPRVRCGGGRGGVGGGGLLNNEPRFHAGGSGEVEKHRCFNGLLFLCLLYILLPFLPLLLLMMLLLVDATDYCFDTYFSKLLLL